MKSLQKMVFPLFIKMSLGNTAVAVSLVDGQHQPHTVPSASLAHLAHSPNYSAHAQASGKGGVAGHAEDGGVLHSSSHPQDAGAPIGHRGQAYDARSHGPDSCQ